MRYILHLQREVECIPEQVVVDPDPGAPFSGYVAYTRSFGGGTGQLLHGAFYEGGADQEELDAYVLTKRRALGIMPDRGEPGTCRPAERTAYHLSAFEIDVAFSHVGEGADDQIGMDHRRSPPSDPLYAAPFDEVTGTYRGSLLLQTAFTDRGLGIHVPLSAPEPTIILPGWDEDITMSPTYTPGSPFAALAGQDIAITWDASRVGGDRIHVYGIGSEPDSLGDAFECFVEPEDQLLTIPSEIIAGLYPTKTDPMRLTIFVVKGSHTTAEYQGRTLDGFNIFEHVHDESTPDPNNPDG